MRVLLVVVVLAALAGGGLVAYERGGKASATLDAQHVNPFRNHTQYADPTALMVAADKQAHADQDEQASAVLDLMNKVPQGIWLLPEEFPTPTSVAAFVSQTQKAAGPDVPLFVVYGIPHRDCAAGESSGGLTDSTYLPWVRAIAGSAGDGGSSAVVLEPDALASAQQCQLRDERVTLISRAVAELRRAGVTTYIDAGHSDWISSQRMATLLEDVGVSSVRGFATDVSNYQPEDAEQAYAARLRAKLGGDTHFVIDTGRDGAAGPGTGDWCNPPGQALGHMPGYVGNDSGLDARLWIKPPAESDGSCHGGPDAGEVWTQRAVEMAAAAGW